MLVYQYHAESQISDCELSCSFAQEQNSVSMSESLGCRRLQALPSIRRSGLDALFLKEKMALLDDRPL